MLEGGSDGLDEEADVAKEEEKKEMEKLNRMIEKMGWRATWNTGSGRKDEKGVKVVSEERHFRRMEQYGGEEGRWEKWWFDLATAIGGGDQELERVFGEVTDPTRKAETKEEMEDVTGREMLGKSSGELFTVVPSLTTGEAKTVVRGTVTKKGGKCGFMAIRKLMTWFNPKTPAKLFKVFGGGSESRGGKAYKRGGADG